MNTIDEIAKEILEFLDKNVEAKESESKAEESESKVMTITVTLGDGRFCSYEIKNYIVNDKFLILTLKSGEFINYNIDFVESFRVDR